LLGGQDSDSLYGQEGDDQLYGQEGDDFLEGDLGNDTLDGSIGNDSLSGGFGDNTYIFGREYGIDTIIESFSIGQDIVKFKTGISPENITFVRKSSSIPEDDYLYLSIKDSNDKLIIKGQFIGNNSSVGIKQFIFTDGTIWTKENIQNWLLQSTDRDDRLIGYQGDDIIEGSLGNDYLNGSTGNNTYIFGRDDGVDTIADSFNIGIDILRFKIGISASDITFIRKTGITPEEDYLYLSVKNTNDRLILKGQFKGNGYGIDQFVFADGTIWTKENIQNWLLQSTDKDDRLIGYQGDDIIEGSLGNDYLNGGTGNNTYIFGKGDGVDTIANSFNTDTDILSFKAGISVSDIIFWRKSSDSLETDNLYLAIKNTNDRLIIRGQFRSGDYGIDQFKFVDETVVTRSEIDLMSLSNNIVEDNLISGDNQANSLEDAMGNDILSGGIGNDIYIFKKGYGQDIIQESEYIFDLNYDIVEFGFGLDFNTMEIVREGNDLIFKVKNNNDRLIIKNQFEYFQELLSVEEFQFDSGSTIWSKEDVKRYLLESTDGDDNLTGYSASFNQTAFSGGSPDTLDGSFGNDILAGETGNDTYIFKQGYGQDVIQESEYIWHTNFDVVKFGADLSSTTMEIIREGNDLVFKVKDGNDRLTIKNQFEYFQESLAIEEFQFNDGAVTWTKDDIRKYLLKPSHGDDNLVGYSASSNESAFSGGSPDILDGSFGNDILAGGTGNDTYIFKQGYGQDIIQESEYVWHTNYDVIKFGIGLTLNTMDIVREGNDLIFKIKGSSDRLTIKNQFEYFQESLSIEEFQFDDGKITWTKEDIKKYLLKSTDADDNLIGYSASSNEAAFSGGSSDTLDGGLGNDTLNGGSGNDTYIFNQSYGQDLIKEGYYIWHSNYDVIKFGSGLNPNTMEIVREGNNLIFKVKDGSDILTIKDQFDNHIAVEEFQFDDGAVIWTKEDIAKYLTDVSIAFSQSYYNVDENGTATNAIAVNRIGSSDIAIGVTLIVGLNGTADDLSDYNNASVSLSFAAGENSKTVSIPIIEDAITEGKETVSLTLANPTGGASLGFQKSATLTIIDNDFVNNPPTVKDFIPNKIINQGQNFNFTIPASTFNDIDSSDVLTYSAVLEDGNILPGWLVFNSKTRSFTGTPSNSNVGAVNIKVTVTDKAGVSVSSNFALAVNNINDAPLVQNIIKDQTIIASKAFSFTFDANTFNDIDPGDNLTYSASLQNGNSLPHWLNFNSATNTFSGLPDHESVGNLSILVNAIDSSGASAADVFLLTVKDEILPQLIIDSNQIAENSLVNTTIGKFTTSDPNVLKTLNYSLVPGNIDDEIFEIVGDELKLKISPDYETKSSYTVRVKVADQDGLRNEQTFTISVTDINEPPTQLVINNSQFTENAPVDTVVGILNATTANGDTLTYSLVTGEGGTDNQFFEIVDNTIRIKITPDFEIKPNYTVRVKATNQNGLSAEKPFPINITNRNEAPTPPTLSNQQLTENSLINIVVGTLATTDPDTGDTLTYSLVKDADNNNLFEIVGTELKLKTTTDYETKPNYSVRIKVTDTAGLSSEQTFTINITDINEAPTQLTIDTPQIAENSPLNTVVAKFATTDPDANENFTYSLTPNNLFTITGNELRLIASPDYETKASYQIQVTSTDKAGLSINQPLTINITDVAEPTILKNNSDRTFQITGDKGSKNITFQISSQHQTKFAETGLFKVDDNLGTINNIKPGDPGYLAAALDRFQIISSIIPIANRPQGFDGNTNRSLNLNYGDIVRFGIVNEGSIDQIRQTPANLNQLILSEPTTLTVTDSNGNLTLNWQTPFNLNLTATIDSTPSLTLGTTTQNTPQGELIDLRQTTTDTTATFSLYREAAYNNHVYFYALQNTTGTILDGTTTLNPTDPGYIQAALRNSIADINLSTTNQSTSIFTSKLTKGTLFAPIIVVNGTKDALLDNNQSNDPNAYTSFILGNADKTDHIRLLGDNTFGFEDLANGGDLDYNDIIVKVNLQSIS
jgi:Ca2+-binding RTX toxin-like protein